VAYSSAGTREIGVSVALGTQPLDIVRLVVGSAALRLSTRSRRATNDDGRSANFSLDFT